jgi:hypothetical protein
MPVSAAPRRPRVFALAGLSLILLAIGLLGAAKAKALDDTYTIEPCGGSVPQDELGARAGLTFEENNGDRFDADAEQCSAAGGGRLRLVGHNTQVETRRFEGATWKFTALPGSEIRKFSLDQAFVGRGWNQQDPDDGVATNLGWRIAISGRSSGSLEEAGATPFFRSTPVDGHVEPDLVARRFVEPFQIEMFVGCLSARSPTDRCAPNAPEGEVISDTTNLKVDLKGSTVNSIALVGGTIYEGTVQKGTRKYEITMNGAESPGIYFGEVWAGGQQVAKMFADDNRGECPANGHFFTLTPCLTGRTTLSGDVDTTKLANGENQVKVVACNATANPDEIHLDKNDCSTSPAQSFFVENIPFNFTPPLLDRTPRLGEKLAATEGTWDPGLPPRTFDFQWQRCDAAGANCQNISGARQNTYTPTGSEIPADSDVGKKIRVVVTATANGSLGQVATVASEPKGPIRDSLRNTIPPVISPAPKVGVELSAGLGVWDDAADSQISFAQQWLRCPSTVSDAAQSGQCEAIAGATQTTYTPVKADVAKRLMVKVSASVATPEALSLTVNSAPSALVAEADPASGPGGGKGGGDTATDNPPQTKISKHPRKRTAVRLARFAFRADQPGASFQCKLDKRPFKPCASPFKRRVKPGRHSFSVRAVSPKVGADPTPASFRWIVVR